jgi:hypothetical protein
VSATLRVVKGDATPEEVAALVAVLTARAAAATETPDEPRSEWSRPRPRLPLPSPGAGAWRSAARDARTKAAW